MDDLRKKGEKLKYKNDKVLQADEKMTPTLESLIILCPWSGSIPDYQLRCKRIMDIRWWGKLAWLISSQQSSRTSLQ